VLHARPAPIIELRADYEINPPLTAIPGRPLFCRWVSDQTGGSSGCSGCVSDQCAGTVRELTVVIFSKERLGRDPLDPPHPLILPRSGPRANTACVMLPTGVTAHRI